MVTQGNVRRCLLIAAMAGFLVAFVSFAAYGDTGSLSRNEAGPRVADGKTTSAAEEIVYDGRTLEQLTGYRPPDTLITTLPANRTGEKLDLPSYYKSIKPMKGPDYQVGGTCWAHATIAAMEFAMIKYSSNYTKTVDLSEQHVIDCNTSNWGCNGGWEAFRWLTDYEDKCDRVGATDSSDYPTRDSCYIVECDCSAPRKHWLADWGYVDGWCWSTPTVEEIKQAIYTYGAVACAVEADWGWGGYQGGVFDGCNSPPYSYNHLVVLYGWDDNQGDEGIWYLYNSWGKNWGESGTMRIPYGCSGVGYSASYAVYQGMIDTDEDGIMNISDNCVLIGNPDQADTDSDEVGDVCDNCPGDYNFDQKDTDNDGDGDVCDTCTDTDHDGYGNPGYPANTCPEDNCPFVSNWNQLDSDADGLGDVCDNCPTASNPGQEDVDGDNDGDMCDNCFLAYNRYQRDTDGDGFGDSCEVGAEWYAFTGLFPDETCPAWTLINTADPEIPAYEGDTLLLATSEASETMYYEQTGPQFAFPAEGLMFEFKARYVTGPAQVWYGDGQSGLMLWIDQDQIYLWSTWGVKGDSAMVDTDDDFHYYHIVVSDIGDITVYQDYVEVLTGVAFADTLWAPTRIGWGDGSNMALGSSKWSFFRHNGYVNDADSDGDYVIDVCDNCPGIANTDQADADLDEIGDVCDNCIDVYNPDQADADEDGIGDLCDECVNDPEDDIDEDGLCADVDNCPYDYNPDQWDTDGDGDGDACDPILVPTQFATIQEAIDSISDDGAVLVEPGTYTGTGNTDIHLRGKPITVTTQEGPLYTIIDCLNSSRGFIFDGAEDTFTVVSGFTITNGYATNGGGIYITDKIDSFRVIPAWPKITDCIIRNCEATSKGGGIYVTMSGRTVIENSTIVANIAPTGAGIAYAYTSSNTKLNRNIIAYNNGVGIENLHHYATTLSYTCNVFWENSGGDVVNISGAGSNNRTIDPAFCDPDNDDFKLSVYSPCVALRSPCDELAGATGEFCATPYANRGDVDLNSTPWETNDFTVFNDWFDIGDSAYAVDVEAQRKASDFNCDGFFQSMADYLYWYTEDPGYPCLDSGPVFSFADTLWVMDASGNKGQQRVGIKTFMVNSDVLSSAQARITYSTHQLTPHWDTALGGNAVEYERLSKLMSGTPNYSDGDVSVVCNTPGEILIYLKPSDITDPNIYINAGRGYFLEIFFDVNDGLVPLNMPITPTDDEYRVNLFGQQDAVAIIPKLRGGTFSVNTNPSCPVLYAYDGSEFVRENPLLTACEQTGYREAVTDHYHVTVPVAVDDGTVRFQLREEENEVAFLDNLELITVDHKAGTRVAASVDGQIYVLDRTVAPVSAVDDQGVDRLAELSSRDGQYFSSDQSGYLKVTFPITDDHSGFDLGSVKKEICPPPETPKAVVSNPPSAQLTVEYQVNGGAWIQMPAMPPRVVQEDQFIFIDGLGGQGGTITLKVTWDGSYATDAILQVIPSDEVPVTAEHIASAITFHPVSGSATALKRLAGAQPLQMVQGEVLDLVFTTGSQPAQGMTRDYIIKASGRYVPKYMIDATLPRSFALHNNYPNPFNPATTIAYDLPAPAHVTLEIFNVLGQKVRTLVDDYQEAGAQTVVWDGRDSGNREVATGVYFYKIRAGDFTDSKKMLLLK